MFDIKASPLLMIASIPRLSVIIPVYNTADYLPECFDSIIAQSIQDIEVIVVDDGSTDNCWEIIKKYALADSRFRIFQQNRKRQGAARNMGLKYALGSFISFVDSDDILPLKAFECLYQSAERFGCDMVIGAYQSFSNRKKWFEVPIHKQLMQQKETCTNIHKSPELIEDISVCNRIIKRSIIEEHGLEFPERYAGEDVYFMSKLYLNCKTIATVPQVIYYCRRQRKKASSSRITSSFFKNRKDTALALHEVFKDNFAIQLYPYLLQSEVRKLVGSRLARVVKELPKHEQLIIFEILQEMSCGLSQEVIYQDNYFNAVHKLCIRLLQEGEVDGLVSFEQSVTKITFLRYVQNKKLRTELAKLILPLYVLGFKRAVKKLLIN